MKVICFGDVHKESSLVNQIIKQDHPDLVLQVGDLETYWDPPVPFIFIKGNHENYDTIDALASGRTYFRNLQLLQPGSLISLEKENFPIRVGGLGGNYSPKFYSREAGRLRQGRRRHYVEEQVNQCKQKLDGADIFMSHECSEALGITRRGHNVGRPEIDDIIRTIKPKIALSGHHHQYKTGQLGNTLLIGLPYPRIGYLVIEFQSQNVFNYYFNHIQK
jgi:predicted phosphodiesterase